MISRARLSSVDSEIAALIQKETRRKEFSLELIPSENCVSEAVLEAVGSIMTDKYCEGYPGARYYGGCVYYDEVERLAQERTKQLFGAEAANVQPHSGSSANMAVYYGLLQPGDVVLGPRLDHGGHLTHGSSVNFSGKYFKIVSYGVDPETECFEAEEVMRLAKEHKPKMIICGATAYSRQFDWAAFRKASDEVGAILMADIAHYAGLIAGGAYQNPLPLADVVTTTSHKTLRGPRGGIIMGSSEKIKQINKMIFPGLQGGPLMHQIAGKAVALKEAQSSEFKTYALQIVRNAKSLASALAQRDFRIVSGGTDSHLMVLDLRSKKLAGTEAEAALGKVGITVNRNTIPNDPNPPKITSGIRLGTPAVTSRGFDEQDMEEVAACISDAIDYRNDDGRLAEVRERIVGLCQKRPLFPYRLED